jgi:hypothetical protein
LPLLLQAQQLGHAAHTFHFIQEDFLEVLSKEDVPARGQGRSMDTERLCGV